MSVKSSLREELLAEIKELNKIAVGTEQHKIAVDSVTKLADRVIEMEKLDIDISEKEKDREIDTNLKLRSIEEDRKDRKIKNWIAIGSGLLTAGVAVWGTIESFKFEKEGTITSIMGRGYISSLLPKFKKY